MMRRWLAVLLLFLTCKAFIARGEISLPSEKIIFSKKVTLQKDVAATGLDKRVEINWSSVVPNERDALAGYWIYRAASPGKVFIRVNQRLRQEPFYSDWIGKNNKTYFYKVAVQGKQGETFLNLAPVSATTRAQSEVEFLDSVQRATFRFFYDGGHPSSGLARDRYPFVGFSADFCAIGGTGMGFMAFVVGAERGFAPREVIVERSIKILRFLRDRCGRERYHGAFPHWLNGKTGTNYDSKDECDLVETSYLAQGLVVLENYFNRHNHQETELRALARELREGIEWNWFLKKNAGSKDQYRLPWGWSPANGPSFFCGGYDETMILYLMAIASPTHSIPVESYRQGWVRSEGGPFYDGSVHYGYKQYVTRYRCIGNKGMPLFWLHYSFLGFDPRGKSDGLIDQTDTVTYFDVCRNIVLIDRAYCADNPNHYQGYQQDLWGLTASDDPAGYKVHHPGGPACPEDTGTITPSASISSIVFTPRESIACMRRMYDRYGESVWGEYGYKDAFTFNSKNPQPVWVAKSYLAIDQGPIIIMIENYRTQLLWKLFMQHPEIQQLVKKLIQNGWKIQEVRYP